MLEVVAPEVAVPVDVELDELSEDDDEVEVEDADDVEDELVPEPFPARLSVR